MPRAATFLALVVFATGCATSRAPATLTEANALLDGREARLSTLDGHEFVASSVTISDTVTTFTSSGGTRSVPTDSLLHVAIAVRRSRLTHVARSTATGAAPGLVLTGVGLAWVLMDVQRNHAYFPSSGPALTTTGGVLLLAYGTLYGIAHGLVSDSERWHVVYPLRPPPPDS